MSLKDRLERYLRNNPRWLASGELQRIVMEKTTYTPRTTVRRLEELENAGVLEVEYRKGHAFYRYAGDPVSRDLRWFDDLPVVAQL